MLIMLHLGSEFLKRQGQSQEYLDSWVILLWVSHFQTYSKRRNLASLFDRDRGSGSRLQGIVNTFTMHHDDWLHSHWSHKDMQHTMSV